VLSNEPQMNIVRCP